MVDFRGKFVLAPMVRVGELPTRLLALKHGADLVWGPETIDKKILQCERVENRKLGTIDFLSQGGSTKVPGVTNLVFRVYPPAEKGKLIFQMGTANAELAVRAAKIVVNDVSGIDVNAGCPKHFSIHSGMGAALLSTPALLEEILTRLVTEVGRPNGKPISVKIRVLENEQKTLELVERLVKTGISNLTVHCRTKNMRNREAPIRDYLEGILERCRSNKVSLVINGGIKDRNDFIAIQEKYGMDVGAMVASEAELNPTCFRKVPLPWREVCKEFLEFADRFANWKGNSKYCLGRIVPGGDPIRRDLSSAKEHNDLMKLFEVATWEAPSSKENTPLDVNTDTTSIDDAEETLTRKRSPSPEGHTAKRR
ncbi:hypothetical protein LJB42_002161 [Komagataella kurtzmanii]|nr:hypothetical protein LJB42_002161 [Komagataella kurtzmanii]